MVTRKIANLYEGFDRILSKAPTYRVSEEEFAELLIRGIITGYNENYIESYGLSYEEFEWTGNEYDKSELMSDAGYEADGKYHVSGDVIIIHEAICPDDMSQEEFNNLSFKELNKKIYDGDIEIQSDSYLVGYCPVNLSENISFSFKNRGGELSFNINLDNWKEIQEGHDLVDRNEFYSYNQYKEDINNYFNCLDDESLESIIKNNNDYHQLQQGIDDFADNMDNDFNISSDFIITDEMRNEYKRIVESDLDTALNKYIDSRKNSDKDKPKTR